MNESTEISFKCVVYTLHARERMQERKISKSQVKDVLSKYTHITDLGDSAFRLYKQIENKTLVVGVCINRFKHLTVSTTYWEGVFYAD